MVPRNNIIALFSTFALLEGDYFRQWLPEPRLQRSMRQALSNTSELSESDKIWALYWYKCWQTQDSRWAASHLTAYLQEPCYWVAQSLGQRVRSTQYTVADYFQIANSEIQRVLQHFAPDRGSTLKSYASLVLTNVLKDTLRQRQAADICSDWSLLRKVSKKRVADVLTATGVKEPEISQYKFAWFCFKSLSQNPMPNYGRPLQHCTTPNVKAS
jgi:Sigma-70 region 2